MKNYKLYKLFDSTKHRTLETLHNTHQPFILLEPNILCISLVNELNNMTNLYQFMEMFQTKQILFTARLMKQLIQHFGKARYNISLTFSEELPETSKIIIEGYLYRLQNEHIEPLRIQDLHQLLSEISYISTEHFIDIEKITLQHKDEWIEISSTGFLKASSDDVMKNVIYSLKDV